MPIVKRPGVVTTPTIDKVLDELEPFADEAGITLVITSGLRDPLKQLGIVERYAGAYKIEFPEFDANDVHKKITLADGSEVYAWQRTWSRLLFFGIIINPPLAALCLEHYVRPNGEDMFGKLIHGSPHGTGFCFDEQADANLGDKVDEIPAKVAVLEKAQAAGVPIKSWVVERKNNALHVNCLKLPV